MLECSDRLDRPPANHCGLTLICGELEHHVANLIHEIRLGLVILEPNEGIAQQSYGRGAHVDRFVMPGNIDHLLEERSRLVLPEPRNRQLAYLGVGVANREAAEAIKPVLDILFGEIDRLRDQAVARCRVYRRPDHLNRVQILTREIGEGGELPKGKGACR